MPSALSASSAKSISASEPFVSGSGSAANRPKRPGKSRTICAAYSLQARASRRDCSTSPNQMPGVVTDRSAVATPFLSISSTARCGDHPSQLGMMRPPPCAMMCCLTSSNQNGGTVW